MKNPKEPIEPIKSQEEYEAIRKKVIETTARMEGISIGQATRRYEAFRTVQDKIMNKFDCNDPSNLLFQIIVDVAMTIPQQ